MSIKDFDVEVKYIKESHNGFSVCILLDGKMLGHTFPKEAWWLDEDEDGVPAWLNSMLLDEVVSDDQAASSIDFKKDKEKKFKVKKSKIDDIKKKKKPLHPVKAGKLL